MSTRPSLPGRLAVGGLQVVCRLLPARLLLGLADLAGAGWYALAPGRRAVAHENLRIAFGDDLSAGRRRRIARASFRGLARVFVELALARRVLGSERRAKERLRYLGDWTTLVAEAGAGRTGLIVTGHLGNWEVGALAIRRRGVPLGVVARPLDKPALEAWLLRQRGGADVVIPKVGGLSDVVRRLASGTWIALLADQNAGRHGLFVPFFGLEASTFPTPAALAERFQMPLYLGVCVRRPGPPCSFDVHMHRLESSVEEGREGTLRAINAWLEELIREHPEQYNWIHRRWKTRPPGRDASEPGRPSYARLWPTGSDGRPMYGREPMP